MEVRIKQLAKRYNKQFVFKNIHFHVPSKSHFGIAGKNGSGKSSLIQILSQQLLPSLGEVLYFKGGKQLSVRGRAKEHFSFTGPHVHLPNVLRVKEIFECYNYLFKDAIPLKDRLAELELKHFENLPFENLSSGMQQRCKLYLCIHKKANLYLFDEPTNFLDNKWRSYFAAKVKQELIHNTVIIASNDRFDLDLCSYGYDLNSNEIKEKGTEISEK